MEADGAEGGVQPGHGEGDKRQHRRAQAQPYIVAQGQRLFTAEQAEAQPVGHQHGQKHHQAVGEDVELVQQSLIFTYHVFVSFAAER